MTTTDPTTGTTTSWFDLAALGFDRSPTIYVDDLLERIEQATEQLVDLLTEAQGFGTKVEMAHLTVQHDLMAATDVDDVEDVSAFTVELGDAAAVVVDTLTGFQRVTHALARLSRLVHPDLVFAPCVHLAEQAHQRRVDVEKKGTTR